MDIQTNKSILNAEHLLALYEAVGWNEENLKNERVVHDIILKADLVTFIYEQKRLVAFGRLNYDGFIAEVKDVMTHPDFRKQGYVSKIMESIINHAGKKYSCIKIVDGGTIPKFYKKFGFLEPRNEKVYYLPLKK